MQESTLGSVQVVSGEYLYLFIITPFIHIHSTGSLRFAGTQFRRILFSIYSLFSFLFCNWGTFACALPRDLIIQLLLMSQPHPPPCEVPFAGRSCFIGYVDHCILIESYTQGFIGWPVCGYLLWSSSVGPLWSLHPHPTRQHPPTFLGFVSRSVHRSLRPSY